MAEMTGIAKGRDIKKALTAPRREYKANVEGK